MADENEAPVNRAGWLQDPDGQWHLANPAAAEAAARTAANGGKTTNGDRSVLAVLVALALCVLVPTAVLIVGMLR